LTLPPTAAPGKSDGPASLLALAVWAAIITGFGELAVLAGPLLGPDFGKRSRDAIWMIPAFDGILFVSVGLLLIGLGRVRPVRWQLAAGVFAAAGAFLVLLLFRTLHPLGALLLAVGIGSVTTRLTNNRERAAARLVGQSVPWLMGSVAALAVLIPSWRAVHEQWLIHHRSTPRPDAPNVLLLILDTVRAVNLSLYGYPRQTTPELDSFAARATVFNLAFATGSWTTLSHASMFTGRWPTELDVRVRHQLGSRWPTLAERLRDEGYATAGFVANQIYAGWESGLARGFEHFEDYPIDGWTAFRSTAFGDVLYPKLRWMLARSFYGVPLLWRLHPPVPHSNPPAEEIVRHFLSWVDRPRPGPFFAFLNFMDAHLPYTSPDSCLRRFRSVTLRPISSDAWQENPEERLTPTDVRPKQARYDGSIACLDGELASLFRELQRRGVLDHTLVIIAGDHGDEFAEHGMVDHGVSLYRFSLHVPLILSLPGRVPEGRRVTAPVSLRNLAATVLALVAPDAAPLPGRALTRFWTGPDTAADTIFASLQQTENLPAWYPVSRGDLKSVAFDGWRYIRNDGDGAEELYDFEHDWLERWNMIGSDSTRRLVPDYRRALTAFAAHNAADQVARR